VPQRVLCGKPSCHCAKPGGELHGPYWYNYWKMDRRTKSKYVEKIDLRRARETAKVEAIALKVSGQGGRGRIKQCSIIDAEVERGSLQLSFIRFKEIEYYGYSILDFLIVLVVIVSILTAYCTGDEVYGLNTWALF